MTARFHVSDTNGRSVTGALVYMIGIPYNRISVLPETKSGTDGWASFQFKPTAHFPISRGGALVVFVRARTPQGSLLAGSSTRPARAAERHDPVEPAGSRSPREGSTAAGRRRHHTFSRDGEI